LTELHALNFGPGFRSEGGIVAPVAPTMGAKYQVLVPQVGKDGLNIAGIRQMEIRAPLGTNMGWNVRASGRREGNLCGLTGSFLPFAATRAQRMASNDPRESLEERYKDHQGYVNAVKKAAAELKAAKASDVADFDAAKAAG